MKRTTKTKLRVLVACEFSGIVRSAFESAGHEAHSCDLLPSEIPSSRHYQGDIRDILSMSWDLMIAFPPCTYLAVSGNRWMDGDPMRKVRRFLALEFVKILMRANIPKICVENPVSVISTRIRKPDQIIQPYMFGHRERKTTCLWLKGLPDLVPTKIIPPPWNESIHLASPGPDRWKFRSRTFEGIAKAMAEQWG